MERAISAVDATRNFSAVLRSVCEGNSYVVTDHGWPIARIVPAGRHQAVASSARNLLLKRLASQAVIDVHRWSRDERYEDEA